VSVVLAGFFSYYSKFEEEKYIICACGDYPNEPSEGYFGDRSNYQAYFDMEKKGKLE
jgi:hypothetical protein